MNKKELVAEVAKKLDLPLNQVDTIISTITDVVKKTVKSGDSVVLVGFGTFVKRRRAARMGVNPSTGEKLKIKAKTVAKFRPGKAFTDMLNIKGK